MSTYRAQVILPKVSGLPEDSATNTWHFITQTTPASTAQQDEIVSRLTDFYTDIQGTLSNQIDMALASVKLYDLADPTPRVPQREELLSTTGSNTGDPHPSEVALVLSFRAITLSGDNAARRRGRLYFGPLDRATSSAANRDRPDATVIDAYVDAAQALVDLNGTAGVDWVVYSPTDDDANNVVSGWMDNAFDTQRRRGVAPTSRETFSV